MRITLGTKRIVYPQLELVSGITLITGASGVGKTTLLRAIHGELVPEGEIAWSPTATTSMMPQQNTWVPYLTMREHLKVRSTAVAGLDVLGLEDLSHKYPHELSVGQLQRFSLVSAMSVDADYYLLDEPSSALDTDLADRVFTWLDEQKKQRPEAAILIVTHDLRMMEFFKSSKRWDL